MKGSAVITCLCLICQAFGQKVFYRGNQLWKITNDANKTVPKLLHALESRNYLSVWGKSATSIDAMIDAKYLGEVKEKFEKRNVTYKVSIEDVQRAIDQENPESTRHSLTWTRYHRLEDIYEYLSYLSEKFPQLCTLQTIGRSVEGRPIKLLKISNQKRDNPAIFIEGGIHAREWISPASVTYIIKHLIGNEPSNIDWYIVPVLNPDGYEYTHTTDRLWRKNRAKFGKCVGVDLNRNFGYDWGKTSPSDDPCYNCYKGPSPFSEPETATIANFFENHTNITWKGYISVHSYGQYIVYPWGSPKHAPIKDYKDLEKVGYEAASAIISAANASYTVGPTGKTIYSVSGIAPDWARGSRGIKYAFTLELRDTGNYGFLLPSSFIKAAAEEALIFVKIVAKAVRKKAVNRAQ